MGVFSEIAMEQQNSMFDSSAAFEDDEAFELEEMESLPVPPVGTDTVPVSAASVSAGETALADAEEEPADEVAPAGEEKSAEEGNSAQPPAAEDEEKKRAEHEAAEAQRKAEFDAKQQAKKAAEQEQIARLEAMSDEEVIAASTQRVSTDVEKLTRRNMKECVSEHIWAAMNGTSMCLHRSMCTSQNPKTDGSIWTLWAERHIPQQKRSRLMDNMPSGVQVSHTCV